MNYATQVNHNPQIQRDMTEHLTNTGREKPDKEWKEKEKYVNSVVSQINKGHIHHSETKTGVENMQSKQTHTHKNPTCRPGNYVMNSKVKTFTGTSNVSACGNDILVEKI